MMYIFIAGKRPDDKNKDNYVKTQRKLSNFRCNSEFLKIDSIGSYFVSVMSLYL